MKALFYNIKLKKILGLIILTIIVATITIIILTLTNHPSINEEYFTNDDTKTTISLSPNSNKSNDAALIQTYLVYTYDGENVSSLKTYFEYIDEETAKTTFKFIKNQPEFKDAIVEGKYIIVAADESQYRGLTASDIQQQTDALKALQDSKNNNQ